MPDATRDRIAVWHNARKSLTKIRVQLLGALVHDLPEDLRIRAYDVTHRGPFPDYLNISVDW